MGKPPRAARDGVERTAAAFARVEATPEVVTGTSRGHSPHFLDRHSMPISQGSRRAVVALRDEVIRPFSWTGTACTTPRGHVAQWWRSATRGRGLACRHNLSFCDWAVVQLQGAYKRGECPRAPSSTPSQAIFFGGLGCSNFCAATIFILVTGQSCSSRGLCDRPLQPLRAVTLTFNPFASTSLEALGTATLWISIVFPTK